MKKQRIFSTPQPQSKRIRLFNPNAANVDQVISNLKSILTSYLVPSSFLSKVSDEFSNLRDKVPKYNSSIGGPESNRIGDFDQFWAQWIIFREEIMKTTKVSVITLCQQFINEKFNQFNEIVEDLNTKPPSNMPLFREYHKAKKDIQSEFEILQQILLEQFDIDLQDDDDENYSESQIQLIIKNLNSQRTKIRNIKTDVSKKLTPFFMNSAQDKSLSENQQKQCVEIIDDILTEISALQKQYQQFKGIRNEISKSENQLRQLFPPNRIEVPPFDSNTKSTNHENDDEEEEEEEEEAYDFLEEEEEEEEEAEMPSEEEKEQDVVKNHPIISFPKQSSTPPPKQKQHKSTASQNRLPLENKNSKTQPRLDVPDNALIDLNDDQRIKVPTSSYSIKNLPDIKPLNLDDDVDVFDTFRGISLSFLSSSDDDLDTRPKAAKNKDPTETLSIPLAKLNHVHKDGITSGRVVKTSKAYRTENASNETDTDQSSSPESQKKKDNSPVSKNKDYEFYTQPTVITTPSKIHRQPSHGSGFHLSPGDVEELAFNNGKIQNDGLRQQLKAVTKEKNDLQEQLNVTKEDLTQLQDDYHSIVVQLEIAYEENKEGMAETEKLNGEIDKLNKEKDTLVQKVKELQQLLVQTPITESSASNDLPEKLLKLNDSSDDDDTTSINSTSKSGERRQSDENDSDESESANTHDSLLLYQTRVENLGREKDALYENISKLADENAKLKEELAEKSNPETVSTAEQQPFYLNQVKLLEENQEYFSEEIQRIWKLYDSLLNRLNEKTKDDSVYFENSKLHKEKAKLQLMLNATKKELQFLKDLRKSSISSKSVETPEHHELFEIRKRFDDEKRKNDALIKALREEKQKTAAEIIDESEHRQLFNAKLTIHNLQRELQRASSKIVHIKGKYQRAKMQLTEMGIDEITEEVTAEADAMRNAYESAIEWGYAQQELALKEQSEKETLKLKIKLLEDSIQKSSNQPLEKLFDSTHEEILQEMRNKIEENLRLQKEINGIREQVVEALNIEDDQNLSTSDLLDKALNPNEKK